MSRLVAALALLLLLAPAPARSESWHVDPDHSQVLFTVRHVVGEVTGFFNGFSGQVEFDPEDPEHGLIDIQIIVSSIDTGFAQRDLDLLGPDFLHAGLYPTIRFVSDNIVAKGGNAFEAVGHLTIKGVSRSESLPFEILDVIRSPLPEQPCTEILGLRGRLAINRLDYNVGDGEFFDLGVMGDAVALTVRAELLRRLSDCQP